MKFFKGVTLSGGQRARIGLARAIYANADIYILDDPLAAVDPEVASRIYTNCVQGILKSKTRILITHQHQFLADADKILYLDEGEQKAFGDFNHIMSCDSQFIKSLKISGEKIDNARSKEYVHFRNGTESEWTPTYESRTTGKINSIDLIYFLRACGSNTVRISFLHINGMPELRC